MNPLGIGLAFALFWAMIGLGLFLTFTGFIGLGKAPAVHNITAQHSASRAFSQLRYAIVLIVGLALLVVGCYAIYVVIYRG